LLEANRLLRPLNLDIVPVMAAGTEIIMPRDVFERLVFPYMKDWANNPMPVTIPNLSGMWLVEGYTYLYTVPACTLVNLQLVPCTPVFDLSQQAAPRGDSMNYSSSIFLINPNVRAIACIYKPDPVTGKSEPRTIFKSFDASIKVGDIVVVPSGTRHGFTTNLVVEVDVEPDLDSSVEMKWIVARVDRSEYDRVLAEEGRAIKLMRDSETTHKREELRKKVMAHVDTAKLDTLRITTMGAAPPGPRGPVGPSGGTRDDSPATVQAEPMKDDWTDLEDDWTDLPLRD